jgi:hypothetical protein
MARTTHRSKIGTKLYAKRLKGGQFDDIQTFKRSHGQDVKRSSAAERADASKKKTSKEKNPPGRRRRFARQRRKCS